MTTTNPLLTDHALFQRDLPLPLRGVSTPGAAVSITFRGHSASATAGPDGIWSVTLPPQPAGGPHDLTLTIAGNQTIIRDILIGDIWVCSGQSNMEMSLADCNFPASTLPPLDNPNLRLLRVPRHTSRAPLGFLPDCQWQTTTPSSAAAFSAIGFLFGQQLQQHTGIPIGLIQAAVGNTPCETWIPRSTLLADASFSPIFDRAARSIEIFPDPQKTYQAAFAEWDPQTDLAERQGRRLPGPQPKLMGPDDKWIPGACYHGMIAPLTHSPIKGVIWFQGAGAPERAYQYRRLFQLLIRDWRAQWHNPSLPFYFVQESLFGPRRDQPCEHSWAELREAQAMALSLPHTAMAVAIDTGDAADIHPKDKAPLAHRLALLARAKLYGQNIPHLPPTLDHFDIQGQTLVLHFRDTYGGLRTSDNQPPRGFANSAGPGSLQDGNRGFQWAQAHIDGDTISLTSPSVLTPVAARYAWAQNPDCNIINSAQIPLAPFRTDDWPGVTVGIE